MADTEDIAQKGPKKRTFRKFSYRGVDLEHLLDLSQANLLDLLPCRARRRLGKRGLKRKHLALLKKLRKTKKEAPSGEKPAVVKTHLRDMIIVPEMIGGVVGVYNGKTFNSVEVKAEMTGHYLGEFSISYKPVKHGRPGIGATHSSRFIPLKCEFIYEDHVSLVDLKSNIEIKYNIPIFEFLNENLVVAVWPTDLQKRSECRHITIKLDHIFQKLSTILETNIQNVSEFVKIAQEAVVLWNDLRISNEKDFLFREFTAADAISSGIVLLFRSLELEQTVMTIPSPVKEYMDKLFSMKTLQEWITHNIPTSNTLQIPKVKTLLTSEQSAQILLASTSAFKIDATNKGFKGIYPGFQLNVYPVKADSEINSQPVGCEETLRGSLNRLNNAKKLQQETSSMNGIDFVVSIENGIVEATPGVWIDLAFVVVQHIPSNRTSVATSAGVSFPTSFVEQANKLGFQKYTVGSIMAKAANGKQANSMDEANPHSYLTGHIKSRSQLLEEAIHIALGQLISQTIPQ